LKLYGNHWLAHYIGCKKTSGGWLVIDDADAVKKIIINALKNVKAKILFSNSYQFKPQGVTALVGIAESHASIHTWPEDEFAEFDFNTCNQDMDGEKVLREIGREIGAERVIFTKIERFMGEIEYGDLEVIKLK